MLQNGDWVVPMLAHEPFVEKPPLFYLSAAAIARSSRRPLHCTTCAPDHRLYMALTFAFIAGARRALRRESRLACDADADGLPRYPDSQPSADHDVSLLTGFAAGFYGLAVALKRPALGGSGWAPAWASAFSRKACSRPVYSALPRFAAAVSCVAHPPPPAMSGGLRTRLRAWL